MTQPYAPHAANGRTQNGRTVDWTGYPALFQRVAPAAEPAPRANVVERAAEPAPVVGRMGGVREAFLGFCQAALFPYGAAYRAERTAEPVAASRLFAASEAFGFTAEEVRRLGCGLYTNPAAVREDLRGVGFSDAEIDAAGFVRDDAGRPRTEFSGGLVVPMNDETGRLCDFLFVSTDEAGRGFSSYRFLYGPAKSEIVAFGLQATAGRPAARGLVLVEDVLEALLLQCRGVPNVAAVGGPGQELSPRRWQELARLGVTTVTLAFRRDARHTSNVRDALVGALRARSAPEVYVANPYPAGERSAADVLRRLGADACRSALEARALAFHDKDFGVEERARPADPAAATFLPAVPAAPAYAAPPAPAEPHYRAAFRKHLAELAAGLPAEQRTAAEATIEAVGLAMSLGDFPRANWLIDSGSARQEPAAPTWFWTTWAGGYASPRPYASPMPAVPAAAVVPAAWQGGWQTPAWPAAAAAPVYHPLAHTETGRALLGTLRDWLRREREVSRV